MELKLMANPERRETLKTKLNSKPEIKTAAKKKIEVNSNPRTRAIFEKEIGEEEKKPRYNKILYRKVVVVMSVLAIVLLSLFIVKPALIGYSVYKQAENGNYSVSELGSSVQNLQLQLATTKANLSLYQEVYGQVWGEVKSKEQSLSECVATREELTSQLAYVRQEWKNEVDRCQNEIDRSAQESSNNLKAKDLEIVEALKQRDESNKALENFAKNLAKSVCCKAKVDDPSINSYEVINDNLVCITGGSNSLSC